MSPLTLLRRLSDTRKVWREGTGWRRRPGRVVSLEGREMEMRAIVIVFVLVIFIK